MPKIPEYRSNVDSETRGSRGISLRESSSLTGFGVREASALGNGIMDVAKGIATVQQAKKAADELQTENINRQLEIDFRQAKQKAAQDAAKEVATRTSQMRLDWAKTLREAAQNPNEEIASQIIENFSSYKSKLVDAASSQDAAEAIRLQAEAFQLSVEREAYSIEGSYRAAAFGAAFDTMMSSAEDTIFLTKSVDELKAQENLIKSFVENGVATGRINDPSTKAKLIAKADSLAYSWAIANVSENPGVVIDAIEEGVLNNIGAVQKKSLINTATAALKSQEELDKAALRQAFESDRVQRLNTGAGSSFDYDAAKEAFGKTVADQMQRKLDQASKLYLVASDIRGASGPDMFKYIEQTKPKAEPLSDRYAEEQEYHEEVRSLVLKAHQDKLDDPYSFFAQDPAIVGMLDNLRDNPDDLSLGKSIQDAILEKQKSDPTLSPNNYAVMPKGQAHSFIEDFKSMTAVGATQGIVGVRERLMSFEETFSGNVSTALNQLFNTKGGEDVASKINPLMWHLNNPSVFRMTLDAVRKDDEEVMKNFEEKDKTEFNDSIATDKNYIQYRNSVVSTDNSPLSSKITSGTRDVFKKFARDYVLNGGSTREASEVFFSYYTFGEYNNISFARPRQYQGSDGKIHAITEDMAELSNSWLEVEVDNIAYNLRDQLDPSTVLASTSLLTEDQVLEDVTDQIMSNAFWSTSEDESGVYLFVKGENPGTSVQVKKKDGSPVFYPFDQTYNSRFILRKGKKSSTNDMTGDPWFATVAKRLMGGTP